MSDEPTEPIVTSEKKEEDGVHVTYVTTTKKYKVTAEFDTHMLLAGNDSIYPGAVFSGQSVVGGSYTPVDFGKKLHQTISYDLIGKGLAISGKIISYKLRFVDNNELANVVFNGDYTATVTEEVQGNGYLVSLKAKKIVNSTGGKADFYGDLSWKDSTNTDTYATLWGFPNKSTFKTVQGENVVGYKMPGFINFYESHSFAAKTDQFTIELSGLKKDRFLLSDHEFDGVKIMQISSLCTQGFEFYDGYWTGEFTIKAPRTGGKNSEFVEITVGYEVQKAN